MTKAEVVKLCQSELDNHSRRMKNKLEKLYDKLNVSDELLDADDIVFQMISIVKDN